MSLATLERLTEERIGASDLLPDLIDRFAATERLYMLLSARRETPFELIARAQNQTIDLRRMVTHRLQQLELLEARGSRSRAYLYWSSIARMWIAEVEAL